MYVNNFCRVILTYTKFYKIMRKIHGIKFQLGYSVVPAGVAVAAAIYRYSIYVDILVNTWVDD